MRLKLALTGTALLSCCAPMWASAPQPFSEELYVDWNDLRGRLRDEGVDFRIGYISETATNQQGGRKELWRYTDQWTFATRIDLQRLLGLKEARFNVVITDRNGGSLSADAGLGNLEEAQEVYGRDETWRWREFWYGQKYLNGMFDWKIGGFPPGDDFASSSCTFMNLTFCGATPGNVVGNYWYNSVSQWATRIKANFTGFGYVELGAYEINPSYLLARYALDLASPPGATGVLTPFEIGWLPTFGGLLGSYKVGAWYNSSTAPDVVENTIGLPISIAGGEPLLRHGEYGAYMNCQQRLTASAGRDSKPGLSVFVYATYADRRTSTLDSQAAVGMFYTGAFARRGADEIGFAVGETHVNPRIADVERLEGTQAPGPGGAQTSERVAELFYNIHVAGWLDVRPNTQYIARPGGYSNNTNDLIVGLKLAVTL